MPAAGALGGMLLPAVLYLAFNLGGAGADGWGIPMATDVAFALGVLALLGSRVPAELKVLLLALAIVDDVGAIVVIAAFYSDGLEWRWFAVAAGGPRARGPVQARQGALPARLRRPRRRRSGWRCSSRASTPPSPAWRWACSRRPARSSPRSTPTGSPASSRPTRTSPPTRCGASRSGSASRSRSPSTSRTSCTPGRATSSSPSSRSPTQGSRCPPTSLRDAATAPVTLGVVVGLVVGKLVGVAGAIALVVRFGGGRLPDGITQRHVLGMAAIAGIGFTVSIFVAGLAFERPGLADQAKIGVLVASRAGRARRVGHPAGGPRDTSDTVARRMRDASSV